ncbi:MFS transporter [Thermanaerothrix sp. 4228-RoL]|uniref:MFS transporter n=2 Tax=Thermanaerothrix TaxID=1077886 RepID=A0ABU3NRU6_9CHLR|nr:MFS transporter [Thermanaerothrix sp. 4228-RoL]MDT8898581.1 MFS transporter [Thermanaerothrix sp. 4228-RoL]
MKSTTTSTTTLSDAQRQRLSWQLIVILGLVSALGDVTYETARGVAGPYLLYLGASAAIVGTVSGLGEFLGYALRLVSGYLAERTRAYWAATFLGYGLILCIPLLAFVNRWELAAALLILERIGKAIRSPARDTILSHATAQTGRGRGFALHEFLDQLGGVAGPLLFGLVFAVRQSYRDGFNLLWIPAILMLAALAFARLRVPTPERLEKDTRAADAAGTRLPRAFTFYALFTLFSVAGFATFAVLSYHWNARGLFSPNQIAYLYALTMGVDAIAALGIGRIYDRIGLKGMVLIPLLTLPIPFLGFSQSTALALFSAVLWGVVMSAHETVMRAAIADMVGKARRASAYGIFNTLYGAAWFVSGASMGFLYERSLSALLLFVTLTEILALVMFGLLQRAHTSPEVAV